MLGLQFGGSAVVADHTRAARATRTAAAAAAAAGSELAIASSILGDRRTLSASSSPLPHRLVHTWGKGARLPRLWWDEHVCTPVLPPSTRPPKGVVGTAQVQRLQPAVAQIQVYSREEKYASRNQQVLLFPRSAAACNCAAQARAAISGIGSRVRRAAQ